MSKFALSAVLFLFAAGLAAAVGPPVAVAPGVAKTLGGAATVKGAAAKAGKGATAAKAKTGATAKAKAPAATDAASSTPGGDGGNVDPNAIFDRVMQLKREGHDRMMMSLEALKALRELTAPKDEITLRSIFETHQDTEKLLGDTLPPRQRESVAREPLTKRLADLKELQGIGSATAPKESPAEWATPSTPSRSVGDTINLLYWHKDLPAVQLKVP